MDITRRDFALLGSMGAIGAAALAPITHASATTTPATTPFDPTPYVHPELRFLVPQLMQLRSGTAMSTEQLPMLREMLASAPAIAEAQVVRIPASSRAPEVRAYLLKGEGPAHPKPALIYVHGGGYIAGSAASETRKLRQMAHELDCCILAVEYRLAPETPFPGPLEDCYAALEWLHSNAATLGVDPRRIAIMGESAGGGLAAMLAIAARDRKEIPILFQLLVYPMLDDRTGSTRSVKPPIGSLTWDSGTNRFGWTSFLGKPAGSAHVPAGSVPARVDNLAGLPRTFIGVGSIDLFVSEDLEYARRLIEQRVPTELLVVPGAFHGFQIAAPKADVSQQFNAAIKNALLSAFSLHW
ncbi:MAG TPA: alpha/beta hydrolase [Sphingobium sp.]|uniref:alpha/beta hydrolase n=1 Tax=Sphingobium sp. TaxID=1912891 RepID=UPI002ED1E69C